MKMRKLNLKIFWTCLVLAIMLGSLLFVSCSEEEELKEDEWTPPPVPDISGRWTGRIGRYPFLESDPTSVLRFQITIYQDGRKITGGSYQFGSVVSGERIILDSNVAKGKIVDGTFDGKELELTYTYYEEDPLRGKDVKKERHASATYDQTKSPPELEGYWFISLSESWDFVLTKD